MPKCVCGKVEPILYSYVRPGIDTMTGTALCSECLKKYEAKEKPPGWSPGTKNRG